MTISIKNLGFWEMYVPENPPENHPPRTLYCRNKEGVDWYDFRFADGSWDEPCLMVTADPLSEFKFKIQSVSFDKNGVVPLNMQVLEIAGVPEDNPAPWKLFEQKIYDSLTNTITDPEPEPKYFVSKADMWRRCTDEEAELLYADLRNAPAKYQAIFDGASVIDIRDDFFPILEGVVKNRVTDERAAELLEPTF